ncbi:MAG: ferredoxin [Chloroflexi bacterium]|nr:ferredoxin [Chloroflexota bacterium]
MKVQVNRDMCEGHGKCQSAAPEIFELRDDEISYVLVDEVPAESVARVEAAIRLCPRQAISWVKEK